MSATEHQSVPLDNAEAIEAWDGPLFDCFVQYRHIVVAGLTRYGEEAMRLHPPAAGARVLDVGCGFGDTTRELAARAGKNGSVLGVDASPRFIAAARHDALESSTPNVRFELPTSRRAPSPSNSISPSPALARCSSPTRSPRCATSAGRWWPAGG